RSMVSRWSRIGMSAKLAANRSGWMSPLGGRRFDMAGRMVAPAGEEASTSCRGPGPLLHVVVLPQPRLQGFLPYVLQGVRALAGELPLQGRPLEGGREVGPDSGRQRQPADRVAGLAGPLGPLVRPRRLGSLGLLPVDEVLFGLGRGFRGGLQSC